jgi:alpha-galactosidase
LNRRTTVQLAFCAFLALLAAPAAGQVVQSLGDASITHDAAARTWRVAAGGASMTLTIDPSADYALTSLQSPSGVDWLRRPGPDAIVTVDAVPLALGSRADGFVYESASASTNGLRLELAASFLLLPQHLNVTRHVAVVSGTPTFEIWTTFQALGDPVALDNLDTFQAVVSPGAISWLTGEQPAQLNASLDSEFGRRQRTLAAGQTLTMGSNGRSSEGTVPWIAIDGAGDEFYAASMWSGGWSVTASQLTTGLWMDWNLGAMTTTAAAVPVEGPHALIGIARGGVTAAAAAVRTFVLQGLRAGRPIAPLVTYNTWYAYGTAIDDASMRREMTRAASIGVELFVIDAGWYFGANTQDTGDFTPGLGSWTADPVRFPNGLASLGTFAHSLGMKFGIWVEPERMDLALVGQNGSDESMLATSGGSYTSDTSAMICLAGAAGRALVVSHLTAFLDDVQPDYLKWDNNIWLNCDRAGHGHGPTDGSFAHTTALYQILDALRQRYPAMLIENCSSGGNRLDFGIIRYTDVAWMSDLTIPSVRVRHNLEGLSTIFPPAYLLSFVITLGWEPLHDSPDLPLYARSRMPGGFGSSFRSLWLTDDDVSALAAQIAFYKRLRPLVIAASATLLTKQATEDETQWDVLQETGTAGGIVIFAFAGSAAPSSTTIRPANLVAGASYQVISIDDRSRGVFTAEDLVANGVTLTRSRTTAAQILFLVPQR